MSGPDIVAVQLSATRLPAATATRVGWYAQPHPGAVAAVLWTMAGQDAAAISRPDRMAGLGSIIDALVGRWDLALHGQHPTDGAPICVVVRPRPGLGAVGDGRARAAKAVTNAAHSTG